MTLRYLFKVSSQFPELKFSSNPYAIRYWRFDIVACMANITIALRGGETFPAREKVKRVANIVNISYSAVNKRLIQNRNSIVVARGKGRNVLF